MSETPTPRTDALCGPPMPSEREWYDFARQLERELAEKEREVERLKAQLHEWDEALSENSDYEGDDAPWQTMRHEFDKLRAENARLRKELDVIGSILRQQDSPSFLEMVNEWIDDQKPG